MTARRLYEVHFPLETFTANATLAVGAQWPERLPDGIIEMLPHVQAAQIFAKIKNAGASAPTTPSADFKLQYNLADEDDDSDEVAGDWTELLALDAQTSTGLKKSTVLTDPLPRRLRMVRSVSFAAANDGWTMELWLVMTTRVGR